MLFELLFQVVDEIDLRKCYIDIDRKFKGQHGIILSMQSWRKLVKAIHFIDRKIEVVKSQMKANKSSKRNRN